MRNLILIHGALGAEAEFDRLLDLLNDDYQVYTLELEGHGNTPSNRPFSFDVFQENLLELIQSEQLSKPDIFGYSMGGYVALYTAKYHPELIGEIITLGTKLEWTPEIASAEIRKINPDKIEEKVPHFASYLDSIHEDWKANMVKTAELMQGLGNGAAFSLSDFSSIQNQVHLRWGSLDNMVSREETETVAEAIPNADFKVVDSVPHPLPQIEPATIKEIINSVFN